MHFSGAAALFTSSALRLVDIVHAIAVQQSARKGKQISVGAAYGLELDTLTQDSCVRPQRLD